MSSKCIVCQQPVNRDEKRRPHNVRFAIQAYLVEPRPAAHTHVKVAYASTASVAAMGEPRWHHLHSEESLMPVALCDSRQCIKKYKARLISTMESALFSEDFFDAPNIVKGKLDEARHADPTVEPEARA